MSRQAPRSSSQPSSPRSERRSPILRSPRSASYGGTPRLITSLRTVAPGTDGAITAVGTLAGVLAALLMSLAGFSLGVAGGTNVVLVVALSAFLGTVADSLIGAKFPQIGNEVTNVSCTLVAASLAALTLVVL